MVAYIYMDREDLVAEKAALDEKYAELKALNLSLNMARGKPGADQLELSLPMLDVINSKSDLFASDGTDCRNYGVLSGLPEAKELIASMVDARPEQVIVCGTSSLNVMFDTIARAWATGLGGCEPWGRQEHVKFLCPAPGYDRHFAILEHFGIEMITIPMRATGPNMDRVREFVENDPAVKGIWCVPKYSNPQGYSYSDEVVRELAALKPAAPDFRLFWDNAYAVHHLYDEPEKQDQILNILDECAAAGNPNLAFEFCSTSKITLPGAGVAAFVSSEENVAEALETMGAQVIGHDKINQLRHVRFLRDADGLREHMSKHAALLRPKFECVLRVFDEDFADTAIGNWTRPRGGYFICWRGLDNTAKRTVELCKQAGVTLTGAGAVWPHGDDPCDADLRIAPSFPTLAELEQAARVFTVCARIAALEVLLDKRQ
jgi:aspartate/methionine/tyrosine aminotransferase